MTQRGRKTPPGDGPLFEDAASAAAHSPTPNVADVAPAASATLAVNAPHQGISMLQIGAVSALVAASLWGAWVTKRVTTHDETPQIAKVQLSLMVGEYVQAQARSATPPDQVTAQTKAFMGEIESNLRQRGEHGQIVLVSEAVLSGNVPDITPDLRREVFARVKMPQPAQAINNVLGAMQQAMAGAATGQGAGRGYDQPR